MPILAATIHFKAEGVAGGVLLSPADSCSASVAASLCWWPPLRFFLICSKDSSSMAKGQQ